MLMKFFILFNSVAHSPQYQNIAFPLRINIGLLKGIYMGIFF